MKLILQAAILSLVIHIIYIIGMIFSGALRTKLYQPDITNAWENVETLQNEVVFGRVYAPSPFIYLFTFIGLAFICGIIIFFYKKMVR